MPTMVTRDRIIRALTNWLNASTAAGVRFEEWEQEQTAANERVEAAEKALKEHLVEQPVFYSEWDIKFDGWNGRENFEYRPDTAWGYYRSKAEVHMPEVPDALKNEYVAACKEQTKVNEARPPQYSQQDLLEFEAYLTKYSASKAPAISVPDKVIDGLTVDGWLRD